MAEGIRLRKHGLLLRQFQTDEINKISAEPGHRRLWHFDSSGSEPWHRPRLIESQLIAQSDGQSG